MKLGFVANLVRFMIQKVIPNTDKIDIMIIGAQKAGTTSLKNYLGEHPELQTHPQKEFGYFWDDDEFNHGFEKAKKKYFSGNSSSKKKVAKNAILFNSEKGLLRLREHNPDCRIILSLRNPVERTYSAYQMEHNYGSLKSDFSEMKDVIDNPLPSNIDWRYDFLIGMSLYHKHIAALWEIFPKEQVSIVLYDELRDNPKTLLKNLYAACAVSTSFIPDLSKKYNVTQKVQSHLYSRLVRRLLRNNNPVKKMAQFVLPDNSNYKVGDALRNINKSKNSPDEMTAEMRTFLIEYFKPFNAELQKLIGHDLSNWNH